MSTTLYRQWTWDLNVQESGTGKSGVKVVAWDSDSSTAILTVTTDASGDITQQVITQEVISITTAQVLTTDTKTPHVTACLLYGLTPYSLNINFIDQRADTFYLETNPYITESDVAVVAAYTGITVNHTTEVITLSASCTINKLYDYCQYDAAANPQKAFPEGVLRTTDGKNIVCDYDITVTSGTFDLSTLSLTFASGKYAIMNGGTIYNGTVDNVYWQSITTMSDLVVTDTIVYTENVTVAISDCTVYEVDTEAGETVVLNLTNSTVSVNSDSANITINNAVTITISAKNSAGIGIVDARVYLIAAAGGGLAQGTVITNTLTDATGKVTFSFNYTGDQPVTGRIRKATTPPYYKTYVLGGTITSSGYTVDAILIEDA